MRLCHLHNSVCCEYDVDALFTFMEATLLVTGGGGGGGGRTCLLFSVYFLREWLYNLRIARKIGIFLRLLFPSLCSLSVF